MATIKPTWQRNGGLAKARKIREAYAANPNKCKHCGEAILPVVGVLLSTTREKVFCNSSCAAKYNNPLKQSRKVVKYCACGTTIGKNAQRCGACVGKAQSIKVRNTERKVTKGELFARRGSWQSARTGIRRTSARNFDKANRDKTCAICGYDKHIDIAHIKSVSSFPDTATIAEICVADNLVGLCPNCHWEYDHGKLNLTTLNGPLLEPYRTFAVCRQ